MPVFLITYEISHRENNGALLTLESNRRRPLGKAIIFTRGLLCGIYKIYIGLHMDIWDFYFNYSHNYDYRNSYFSLISLSYSYNEAR